MTNQPEVNRILILILGLGFCASCASTSVQDKLSSQMGRLWVESNDQITRVPCELKTRYNPSPCDENLQYEVNIHGQYRHVSIQGTEDELAALKQATQNAQGVDSVRWPFIFSDQLYTSGCGQYHYILRIEAGNH